MEVWTKEAVKGVDSFRHRHRPLLTLRGISGKSLPLTENSSAGSCLFMFGLLP